MIDWFAQNWGTLLAGAVLLLLVGAAAASLIRGKRRGKTSCGCGCQGCAMRDSCHKK